MVFWIIVIICLLTFGATLFFIFDPAEKEWAKIDGTADGLSDAYWDLVNHKGCEDPEVKELKARRDKVLRAIHPRGSTLRAIAYIVGEDIRTTQAILTVLQKQNKVITECAPYGKIWRRNYEAVD